MNRKTVKPILMSALSALAFGAVGAGATFALFTDKAETHIDVEAGKVDISSSIAVESVKELGDVAVSANAGIYTSSIGATTQVNAANNAVTLSKWTPGDKASFLITTKNFSNVKTKTRLIASHTSTTSPDLYDALTIKYETVNSINEIGNDLFRWKLIPASSDSAGQTISVVRVTIEFKNIGNEITIRDQGINNQFQEANCTIKFTQQAVQGNAVLTNYVDTLNAILTESSTRINNNLFDAIDETGATIADLKANDVVYSAKQDKFFYSAEVSGGQEHEYFKVYDAMPLVQKWSVYAATNTSWAGNLKLEGIGFDAGENTGALNISYVGTGAARENYIRTTNSASDVTINAPIDTVHHYGTAGNLNIIAVAGTSYHEHGKVAFAEIAKGRIALEKESKVEQIHVASIKENNVTTNVFDSIIIAKDSEVELPKLSRDDVDIAAGGTLVVALQANTQEVTQNTELDYVWLTKQGIYEQIKVSDNANNAGTVWADDDSNSATTQDAAQQIANNIGRDVATGEVSQPVSITGVEAETVIILNEDRDLVVVEAAHPEVEIATEAATEAVAAAVEETGLSQGEKEAEATAAKAIANFEEDEDLDYVACIGANGYLTLNAAIAAAKAADGVETITVLKPITSDDGFLLDTDVNINLNGKTITVNSGSNVNSRAFKIDEGKTVSIYNGTIDAKGSGTTKDDGQGCYGAVRAEANSRIDLKNLVLKNYRPWGLNIKLLGATAILDNVKITSSYGGGIEVTSGGDNDEYLGYAKLTNCDFRQSGYYDHCSSPVAVSYMSKVDVYSSYFEGHWGAYVYSSGGTINVYGGEWKANPSSTQNAGSVAVVQSDTYTYPNAVSVINIYDGTFRGTFSQSANPVDSIKVYGGKFDHDPKDYVVDYYTSNLGNDGMYEVVIGAKNETELKYYLELETEKALAIKIAADFTLTGVMNVYGDKTINLAGHTLTVDMTALARPFVLGDYVSLTVNGQNGKILVTENKAYGLFRVQGNFVNLTLNGGEYSGYTVEASAMIWVNQNPTLGLRVNIDGITSTTLGQFIRDTGSLSGLYAKNYDQPDWTNVYNISNSNFVFNNEGINLGGSITGFVMRYNHSVWNNVTAVSDIGSIAEHDFGTAEYTACNYQVLKYNNIQPWNGTTIGVAYGSEVIVNSGTYTGYYGISIFSTGGHLWLKGGTFTGNGEGMSGHACDIYASTDYEGVSILTIEDGVVLNGDIQPNNDYGNDLLLIKDNRTTVAIVE